MMIIIWGVVGVIVGAALGFFIGEGSPVGQLTMTIHLAIAIGFVGLWLGIVFSRKATEHEECHGPLRDSR